MIIKPMLFMFLVCYFLFYCKANHNYKLFIFIQLLHLHDVYAFINNVKISINKPNLYNHTDIEKSITLYIGR